MSNRTVQNAEELVAGLVGGNVIAIGLTQDGDNGVVAYDRGWSPFDEDHTYVTHRWQTDGEGGVYLTSGTYDLTFAEAHENFALRMYPWLGRRS